MKPDKVIIIKSLKHKTSLSYDFNEMGLFKWKDAIRWDVSFTKRHSFLKLKDIYRHVFVERKKGNIRYKTSIEAFLYILYGGIREIIWFYKYKFILF